MRCRASQRRFRNTLLFVAADEAQLATAREAMRRSMAWASIVADERLQEQLTQAQAADAKDKAKTSHDGARKAVRLAWSHVLFPVSTETPGKAFDLDHLTSAPRTARRFRRPSMIRPGRRHRQGEARAGSAWLQLKPLWPEDRPHLTSPRSRTGSRPMSICRSCAIGWCWRRRSATRWQARSAIRLRRGIRRDDRQISRASARERNVGPDRGDGPLSAPRGNSGPVLGSARTWCGDRRHGRYGDDRRR